METGGDQAADMGDVGHDQRPDLVGDGPELLVIDGPGIGTGADDDDLRLVLLGQGLHLVEIDGLGLSIHPVENAMVKPPGKTGRAPVREMAPVGEVHTQDRVSRFEDGKIDGHVGLNARMRLDIGMFRPEELLAPFDGQPLHDVDELASPVVPAAGIALGILVRHHAPLGLQDGLADEVLRGDHFKLSRLSAGFLPDGLRDLRIGLH